MPSVRVAVSGTHGSGKSFTLNQVGLELSSAGYKVATLPSPTREVKSLGFKNNLSGDLGMAFLCVAKRLENEMSADLESYDVVLSDRCLLDEVVYASLDAASSESIEVANSLFQISAIARSFYKQYSRWDIVGLKHPHPDFLPEADGDRLPDLGFQRRVDEMITRSHVGSPPTGKLIELPLDREESVSFLLEEVLSVLRK